MKIGQPADKPALTPATAARSTPAETSKGQAGVGAAEASAKVVLSDTAASMSASAASKADFDAEKVDRIGKSIADGTFSVNPGAIADKLIANARELLDKYSR